jgi:hypothetical protein
MAIVIFNFEGQGCDEERELGVNDFPSYAGLEYGGGDGEVRNRRREVEDGGERSNTEVESLTSNSAARGRILRASGWIWGH